ncbi:MAG TPA: hypothetical protein VE782_13480 [Myxococcaceae bacterium]|nr:hypothetical protein [Myxococcaceae bacterium]
MTGRSWNLAALAFASIAWPAVALADEPKVEILAEVVHASQQGNVIDPPQLVKMKDDLAQKGLRFTSLRRLSQKKAIVRRDRAEEVGLPDGRNASLRLAQLKDDAATVKVTVPQQHSPRPLLEATYRLARQKSTFIHCGPYNNGELFLVLSPP